MRKASSTQPKSREKTDQALSLSLSLGRIAKEIDRDKETWIGETKTTDGDNERRGVSYLSLKYKAHKG